MKPRFADRAAFALCGLTLSLCLCARVAGAGGILTSESADAVPQATAVDVLIRGGTIYDGSGGEPFVGDVAIRGDRIALVGDGRDFTAKLNIDAGGLAVSPGFIDMESSSYETLPEDGRGISDITQGITLTVFGEEPTGLMNDRLREEKRSGRNPNFSYPIEWSTLGGFLAFLEARGTSENFAAFAGITEIRKYVVGWENRPPTGDELARMQELVRGAMREGAMGVGICLSYDLAKFTNTEELTAMALAAAESGGIISLGLRSESGEIFDALAEAIAIARRAELKLVINHLKVSGAGNWDKLDGVIDRIEAARDEGVMIYASMYFYPALWTALSSVIPPWAHEGGMPAMLQRLAEPETRFRILSEMRNWRGSYDNYVALAGKPENVLFLRFKNGALVHWQGKTLADVMEARGVPAEEAVLDLLIENGGEIWTAFFTMAEENIRRQVRLPWVMYASDSEAIASEPPFTLTLAHPRAYGSIPRLFSDYVREARLIYLEEAVRRLTSLPASVLGIRERGMLAEGYYADVVIFDPRAIEDHATFAEPHRYSTGVQHVFVNGTQVLRDGRHTGALPGRFVRGPGWTGDGAGGTPSPRGL
jgi:N-acyl-D-amino-acid deacylase